MMKEEEEVYMMKQNISYADSAVVQILPDSQACLKVIE